MGWKNIAEIEKGSVGQVERESHVDACCASSIHTSGANNETGSVMWDFVVDKVALG
jgi:hypothetical protein